MPQDPCSPPPGEKLIEAQGGVGTEAGERGEEGCWKSGLPVGAGMLQVGREVPQPLPASQSPACWPSFT